MSKSAQAFRTISEVSEVVEVPAHVLRFWESKFTQIKPIKRGGGRRYYRPEDVQLLLAIRELLYTDGLTIRGVQKMLKEQGVKKLSERADDASITLDDFGGAKAETSAVPAEDDLWNDIPAEGLAETETPSMTNVQKEHDPERAIKMRSILTRLESLRERMDSHPAPSVSSESAQ